MSSSDLPWEAPLGAFPTPAAATRFRVWAPRATELALERRRAGGARARRPSASSRPSCRPRPARDYAYVVDGVRLPDPCSRWQPDGLRGASRVLDAAAFAWTRRRASGRRRCATWCSTSCTSARSRREGTFEAAIPHLRGLRELGVTAIELMPVAEFPGRHGWGYDGVYISAAHSAYGGPLGLQRLVDAAHAEGLAVILDVVHNHIGASGVKALEAFGPYLTDKHSTPWGRRSTSTTPARTRCASGSAVGRAVGPRLPRRRAAARRRARAGRLQPRAHRGRDRAPRACGEPARARDRRVGAERPEGGAAATAGAATPPGPTTSTTRCTSR